MKLTNAIKSAVPAAVLGFLALGLASTSAFASTATAAFAVTATVQTNCTVSATALGFGNYTGAVNAAQTSILVTCTNTTPYTLGLSAGGGTSATVTARSMTGPASAQLNYGLFTDSGHTINFATLASANGTGAAQTINVYGQIPAGQFVAPGAYADSITATVTY
jgi:spore coat protein U-like protein